MDDDILCRFAAGLRIFLVLLCVGCSSASRGLIDELDDWQRDSVQARLAASPPPADPPGAPAALESIDPSASLEAIDSPATLETIDSPGALPRFETDDALLQQRLSIDASDTRIDTLLLALARDIGVELRLPTPLPGRVTLRVLDRTAEEILERLAGQVPLYWQFEHGMLEVRGDEPYLASYAVDYLNLDRQLDSRLGLATRVGSINGDAGDTGTANGSETRLESRATQQFWTSLAADLALLLGGDSADGPVHHALNRDAGLLTLQARPDVHRRVRAHLEAIADRAGRQVLIEATVVEVDLADEFAAGVDWQAIASAGSGISALQNLSSLPRLDAQSAGRIAAPAALLGWSRSRDGVELQATLQLLEQFGRVRIVSRPRVLALNNQPAVLKVVDNRVYFTLNVQHRQRDDIEQLSTDTRIHTVPVGLVMNVTPSIDADGAVMLSVRPTLSRILGFVNDPNPALAEARISNGVPEIQVREMESLLRVPDGRLAVIGGLIQERRQEDRRGVPWIERLPLIGNAFAQRRNEQRRTELLLLIRPTVLAPGDVVAADAAPWTDAAILR